MGLSTGDGIAVMSACAVVLAGMLRYAPSKKGQGGESSGAIQESGACPYVRQDMCDLRHQGIDGWMARLSGIIERLESDMRRVLIHMGIEGK